MIVVASECGEDERREDLMIGLNGCLDPDSSGICPIFRYTSWMGSLVWFL